jgi:hypothetical protein
MMIYNKDIYMKILKCHKEAESETSNLLFILNLFGWKYFPVRSSAKI